MMRFTKLWAINNFNHQKGFIALLVAVLILVAMVTISVSMANLIIGQHKISANIIKSSQAYFAAEGGIEDALLRLKKNMQWTNPLPLTIADGFASTTISDIIGGARVIMAEGNVMERIRKVSIVYQVSPQEASFYYAGGDLLVTCYPGCGLAHCLEMQLHCPRRASFNTNGARQAFCIIKIHSPGHRVDLKSIGRADSNTGSAMSAPFLIATYVLAE